MNARMHIAPTCRIAEALVLLGNVLCMEVTYSKSMVVFLWVKKRNISRNWTQHQVWVFDISLSSQTCAMWLQSFHAQPGVPVFRGGSPVSHKVAK